MMSLEQFRAKAGGFHLDEFVKQAKQYVAQSTGQPIGKIRVLFDNPESKAMSRYVGGVLEIHLADIDTIRRRRPDLSWDEIQGKFKAQTIEEVCHGVWHETDHDEKVVGCTVGTMRALIPAGELQTPYIQAKVEKLEMASQPFKGSPRQGK